MTLRLKRTNIFLEPGTMERLKELCKGFEPTYSISASDLVRFALHEVYGTEFTSVHTWGNIIKKQIKFIREKEKFKERG